MICRHHRRTRSEQIVKAILHASPVWRPGETSFVIGDARFLVRPLVGNQNDDTLCGNAADIVVLHEHINQPTSLLLVAFSLLISLTIARTAAKMPQFIGHAPLILTLLMGNNNNNAAAQAATAGTVVVHEQIVEVDSLRGGHAPFPHEQPGG